MLIKIIIKIVRNNRGLYWCAKKIKSSYFKFSLFFSGALRLETTSISNEITLVRNTKFDDGYFYPYPSRKDIDLTQLWILNQGLESHLKNKYSHRKCSVHEGDTVIDCGGFVGGFSLAASKLGASRVIHIEPTPVTQRCASLNFKLHKAVAVESMAIGLGMKDCKLSFNLSKTASDNSILEPDTGATGEVIQIAVLSLDTLAQELELEEDKTFLKIEAEGFELEIVQGICGFLPKKIVIDITPERNGRSPCNQIKHLLSKKGYEQIYTTDQCLFAVRI